jgi:hypothetical protein
LQKNAQQLPRALVFFQRQFFYFEFVQNTTTVPGGEFDVIVFAASIQYFQSLHGIIETALQKIKYGGEIHIIDTHFYRPHELKDAAQRSRQYFAEIGFPDMENFYFHHSLAALNDFSFETLYNPETIRNKILKRSPFRWIRIKKC